MTSRSTFVPKQTYRPLAHKHMIELYQFELSQFAEKARLILDFKGLQYRKIEVVPGVGQLEILRISGQRQVPVIKDGNTIVADSTAIAMYLDKTYPDKPLFPGDAKTKAFCTIMEEWADSSIGVKSRKCLLGALKNNSLRSSILPSGTPDIFRNLVSAIPNELFDAVGMGVGLSPANLKEVEESLHREMAAVCTILGETPYLLGNQPTLVDLTVAALSMTIKVPEGPYLNIPANLKGKGIPGFADNPAYEMFFAWRDRLYAEYRRPHVDNSPPPTGTAPTTIAID
jgi:glutathione S-transferase